MFSLLFELSTFLSLSLEWHADARFRSHNVHILMSFLSPSLLIISFLLYYVRNDVVTPRMNDARIENCSTKIRTCTGGWLVALSLYTVMQCSLSTTEDHCRYSKYFRWSILLTQSNP